MDHLTRRRLTVKVVVLCLVTLAACAQPPAGQPLEAVDPARLTIYYNGTILTMDPSAPTAEAVAVRGEKVEVVGANEEILALGNENTTRIDLGGRVLMPGFVDAHTHLLNDARSQGMSLDQAQFRALQNGITTVGTLYVHEDFLREIRDFDAAGFLRIRTGLYLVATDPCGEPLGDWWKAYPPTHAPGEMLRINGVKIFTDGGSCGRVALSFEPEPGLGHGDLWFSQEELNALVLEVDEAGYQAAAHAIGDRAVHQALNAIEAALAGGPNDLRHRMEHVSVIAPEDLPRFGALGVIPVLMGEYPGCTPYGPPVPVEYGHMEWPWRALQAANPGLPLAWHSDVPFQSINPFDHLLGFVTRIDLASRSVCPPYPWLAENTLPVEDALTMMTIGSAYALNRETEVGSLAPGKYADLIVLEKNPLEAASDQLGDNRVLLTMVGGRIEYCAAGLADLCPGFANRPPVLLPDLRPPVLVRWLVLALITVGPVAAMGMRRRSPDLIRRTGGWLGLIGGAIWMIALFNAARVSDAQVTLLLMVPTFLMALGSAGLATLWVRGRFGAFSLWLMLLGAMLAAAGALVTDWFRYDFGWFYMMVGLQAHLVGLILFGLANLRGRVLRRWNGLPILMGPFGGIIPLGLSFGLGYESDLPLYFLLGVVGGGWVLLGWLIFSAKN